MFCAICTHGVALHFCTNNFDAVSIYPLAIFNITASKLNVESTRFVDVKNTEYLHWMSVLFYLFYMLLTFKRFTFVSRIHLAK